MTKNENGILSRLEGKIDTLTSAVKGNGKGLEERVDEIEDSKVDIGVCGLVQKEIGGKIDHLDKRDKVLTWLIGVGGLAMLTLLVRILWLIMDHMR